MNLLNKNKDIDYTRPFNEYIREEKEYINDGSKKLKINKNLIKRIITSVVLVPVTLAVSECVKVNEKESNININHSKMIDELNDDKKVNNNIDASEFFLASDGTYWCSFEDYQMWTCGFKPYHAEDGTYWVSEEAYRLFEEINNSDNIVSVEGNIKDGIVYTLK